VATTVGVTLLAGVCFHVAMDNALRTRAPRPSERGGEEGREGERFGVMPGEEEEDGREGGRREEVERSGVANQNEAFRRFLMDLEGKDAKTRIEDAVEGMVYFMQPEVGGGGREGGREGGRVRGGIEEAIR